ncbi:glyoxalase [Paenibacillus darwinianus]|uniref:Glyoxalase n=1 Tax=Paenibacillus darwinianus TaxID=1380763 RepID=A0A9W5S0F7_9BACL|nr:VOC family protein [Paenibacillus darwinianus]EXX86469.1 glyoxalase [Paenibacillus darwinianus]EXX91058.1 glyoxalase [Paenibacillus darwinianus]EXX92000.1 glyoxalase [Paenibacillus darwinianus]
MIKGIAHNAIRVTDMGKSLHFYCDIAGLTKAFEIHDDNDKPWIVYLKVADGQFIELFYGGRREYVQHPRNAGSTHICFEVDDIFTTADRLKRHGFKLDIEPMRGKDYNYPCWTKDPDGFPIEFMQLDPRSPQSNS